MASVKREETSAGPRWRVRYRRPDGTETSRRFDRRQKADDFAVKMEHDRRAGAYIDPAGPRLPVPQLVERWKATRRHGLATAATRDSDLRNWVLPHLGRYRIGQVGELELVAFRQALEADLAPATALRVWNWVTSMFAAALRARLLVVNPTVGLAPRRPPRPALVHLDDEQVAAVLAELPGHYRTPALLAADAGLRLGEVFGLTVARVGLRARAARVLMVERQLVTLAKVEVHLAWPKADRVRVVPVAASLLEAVSEHLARYGPGPEVADWAGGGRAGLVFATGTGRAVSASTVDQVWRRAVRRAGLPCGARFHDLRHYYASVLIDAGLGEREIGTRLGHSSTEVTQRYGTLLGAADDRTRAAVEAAAARRQVR